MPEPKTPEFWKAKGYSYVIQGRCPACAADVEIWLAPGGNEVPIDPASFEPHFSTCPKAKEYRTEMRMRAGVL